MLWYHIHKFHNKCGKDIKYTIINPIKVTKNLGIFMISNCAFSFVNVFVVIVVVWIQLVVNRLIQPLKPAQLIV